VFFVVWQANILLKSGQKGRSRTCFGMADSAGPEKAVNVFNLLMAKIRKTYPKVA